MRLREILGTIEDGTSVCIYRNDSDVSIYARVTADSIDRLDKLGILGEQVESFRIVEEDDGFYRLNICMS